MIEIYFLESFVSEIEETKSISQSISSWHLVFTPTNASLLPDYSQLCSAVARWLQGETIFRALWGDRWSLGATVLMEETETLPEKRADNKSFDL